MCLSISARENRMVNNATPGYGQEKFSGLLRTDSRRRTHPGGQNPGYIPPFSTERDHAGNHLELETSNKLNDDRNDRREECLGSQFRLLVGSALVRTEHARSGKGRERCVADDVELRETREHEDQDGQALLVGQVSDQPSEQLVTLLNAE